MDLRQDIGRFVIYGRELLRRLQSEEGPTASDVDLHILKVQLHLLESEATKLQLQKAVEAKRPPFK